ncbi:MAG: riboflavin biosynthesis protein RibF, partial [Prevotella sp.]|nr:riboflavin biosynthesis protein RibF [Prevotella sp.]
IKVSFVSRLREEKHFSSREALVNQMTIDVAKARAILNK